MTQFKSIINAIYVAVTYLAMETGSQQSISQMTWQAHSRRLKGVQNHMLKGQGGVLC